MFLSNLIAHSHAKVSASKAGSSRARIDIYSVIITYADPATCDINLILHDLSTN